MEIVKENEKIDPNTPLPKKTTKKQLQIEENSSGKALNYNEDAAETPWSLETNDWHIEKHRKHLTSAVPPHLQSGATRC